MALSKQDLLQIEELLERKLDEKLDQRFKENNDKLISMMFEHFATKDEVATKEDLKELRSNLKQDINELKDMVVSIRYELDTEHEVRWHQVRRNTADIKQIKQRMLEKGI